MNKVSINIDGLAHEVNEGQNLLQACLMLGYRLPYFCWHPALHSVGACRQCAVKLYKDEHDAQGRIVMSCMTPVANGLRVSIEDPEAVAFRKSVIEWLMTNHPHDCPVCDEGGACHLQDMTVMAKHTYRRFRFKKRTYRNQYLGPFLNHEMNRCIQCYRCVRFYRDYAGGRDFNVFGTHNEVYFGRHAEGVFGNEFSGNLVEICPTGVFTDKTLKQHYTRKWDLQWAPSVCPHCGLGCNVSPGERYCTVRCILNRYNADINGYAICDRGRYGYEHVNSGQRIRQALIRASRSGAEQAAPKAAALERLAEWIRGAGQGNGGNVIGIGSPRASLEANFALRSLVGAERFFMGMAASERRLALEVLTMLREGPARTPSIHDVEACDAVVVLGEDLTNSAPRLALAVRQSVRRQPMERAAQIPIPLWNDGAIRLLCQNDKGPLLMATPQKDKLDDVARWAYRASPDDIARLGFAIAAAISPDAPKPEAMKDAEARLAGEIAQALLGAKRIAVIAGITCASEEIARAAANVAWALLARGLNAELCFTTPEVNTMGAALMGGGDLDAAFQEVKSGGANTVVILENDLFRRADREAVNAFLNGAARVVAIDSLRNATTAQADLVLPAAAFGESSGTAINNEGRAQRFYRSFIPEGEIQDSWRWLRDMMQAAGRHEADSWNKLDVVIAAMARALPQFERIVAAAPSAEFRAEGQKIPRQPHRYSGRTAMSANRNVNEPQQPDDPDSTLSYSMEGYDGAPPAALTPFFWAPGWNSPSAVNRYQVEVGGLLQGSSSGIRLIEAKQNGAIPWNKPASPAFERREGEWLLVPLHHIFGGEELSALGPAIAERVPKPYLALNPKEAAAMGLSSGDAIRLTTANRSLRCPICISPAMPDGVAGMPIGLPGVEWIALPQWVKLSSGTTA
ncbi:MAG: NADH-quinone oxidoreductase subunit NuoG [Candidatus Sumerlaeota bacterium]|nr:NADH-quinone oxidoreductase subunit NuoG [Candidatus Sumerlaeota bacterium]